MVQVPHLSRQYLKYIQICKYNFLRIYVRPSYLFSLAISIWEQVTERFHIPIINLLKNRTGCLKNKWDLFYDQYLCQIQYKTAGYMFDFKGGIHRSVGSTKTFLYHIREPG